MPFPVADESGPEDEQALSGNGALRALKAYEPQTDGERVLVDAVRALSRDVVRLNRRMVQGFVDLQAHVDGLAEERSSAVAVATLAQTRLTTFAGSLQELVEMVRGLDAFVRGVPADRPSSPETPASKSKQVSAPPVEGEDDGQRGH